MNEIHEYGSFIGSDGQLKPERLNDLLVEVISGKHLFELNEELFATRCPTLADQERGRIIYAKRLHQAAARGLLSREVMKEQALLQGVITQDQIDTRANIDDLLRRNIAARQKTTDRQQKMELDLEIENLQKKTIEAASEEEEYLGHTAESYAEMGRTDFYVSCCTLQGDLLEAQVWDSWPVYQKCSDALLILNARHSYAVTAAGIPVPVIRAMARADDWRIRWKSSKEARSPVFDGAGGTWDKNKLALVYWSDFYDSVYSHTEAPDEEIINDDAALQDWINHVVQKTQQDKARAKMRRPGQAGAGSPPTMRDGRGNRRPMSRIGTQNITVNQPYKIRV